MAAVLIIYLATASTSAGMTMATAEYGTVAACEEAGKQAEKRLGGWYTTYTTVRWSCSPKGDGAPPAPQTR
ncbi:hypothetical protein [Methylobacterium brachiatum]|uniref:hypothetical protein n=1 Tax=Methylobacterium brachiatum TaxID=269660 RepID=UPI000EFC3DD9|nr:hypothetical protein [Methylobacterium brachiatum]AYO85347.1 hypothetical protein EBB05_26060 [Methylobacterium brachiatum]